MNQALSLFIAAIMALASYRATRYALDIRYNRVFSISSSIIVALLCFVITSVTLLIDVYSVLLMFIAYNIFMFLSGRFNRGKDDSFKVKSLLNKTFLKRSTAKSEDDSDSYEYDSDLLFDGLSDERPPVIKGAYSLDLCEKVYLEIAFNYKNSNEKITYRDVNVTSCDGIHITGYCHVRRALRTFRLDRIVNDEVIMRHTGEIISCSDWLDKIRGF